MDRIEIDEVRKDDIEEFGEMELGKVELIEEHRQDAGATEMVIELDFGDYSGALEKLKELARREVRHVEQQALYLIMEALGEFYNWKPDQEDQDSPAAAGVGRWGLPADVEKCGRGGKL